MEALEPERHASSPFAIGREGVELAAEEAHDVQRHETEIAEVAVRRRQRRRPGADERRSCAPPEVVDRLEVGEGLERRLGRGREASQGVFKSPVIGERGVGLGEGRMDGGEADGLANECPEFGN